VLFESTQGFDFYSAELAVQLSLSSSSEASSAKVNCHATAIRAKLSSETKENWHFARRVN